MNKKNTLTLYHFVIDRSASMHNVADETIEGFNRQLSTIQELQQEHPDQKYLVSLTIFNHHVDHVLNAASVDNIKLLNRRNYRPSGMTALYDAMGESIVKTNKKFKKDLKKERMSVVMVILTDGMENSSRVYRAQQVSKMMEKFRETGLWTFSVLGADISLENLRENIALRKEESFEYAKRNTAGTMFNMTKSLRSYAREKRSGLIQSSLFIDPEKEENE